MGFLKSTIKGFSLISFFRILTRLITFTKTVIIARILFPYEFGVFGIVSLTLTFLEILTETGVNVVLIQEEKISKTYTSSAWIVSIIRGFIIAFLMIFSRYLVASFFHSPEVANLLLWASLIPILRGFINPSVIQFQKNLLFEKEFKIKFLSFFAEAFFSIILVVILKSVLALILGVILGVIVEIFLSFKMATPRPCFSFSKDYLKKIISRGKWVTLAGIFNYFFSQGDSIAVGRILQTQDLGIYQMAYKIAILPITEITDVVSKVTFPVYLKISNDTARLKRAFLKTVVSTFFLTLLPAVILFLFSKQIIYFVLGEKWLDCWPILKILSCFPPIKAITSSSLTLFYSVKKQEYVSLISFLSFLFLIIFVLPLILKYGLTGAALSVVFSSILLIPFTVYLIKKVF